MQQTGPKKRVQCLSLRHRYRRSRRGFAQPCGQYPSDRAAEQRLPDLLRAGLSWRDGTPSISLLSDVSTSKEPSHVVSVRAYFLVCVHPPQLTVAYVLQPILFEQAHASTPPSQVSILSPGGLLHVRHYWHFFGVPDRDACPQHRPAEPDCGLHQKEGNDGLASGCLPISSTISCVTRVLRQDPLPPLPTRLPTSAVTGTTDGLRGFVDALQDAGGSEAIQSSVPLQNGSCHRLYLHSFESKLRSLEVRCRVLANELENRKQVSPLFFLDFASAHAAHTGGSTVATAEERPTKNC